MRGEQNHAGTVLMHERRDALAAGVEIIYNIEQLCRYALTNFNNHTTKLIQDIIIKENKDSLFNDHDANFITCTTGQLNVSPGSPNVIPGI